MLWTCVCTQSTCKECKDLMTKNNTTEPNSQHGLTKYDHICKPGCSIYTGYIAS